MFQIDYSLAIDKITKVSCMSNNSFELEETYKVHLI